MRWLLALALLSTSSPSELVEITSVVADVEVGLAYARAENFVGVALYPVSARCLVLPEVAARLRSAAESVRSRGFRLKLLDCYRPPSVQRRMWALVPRPGYVADPTKGSPHNRGAAVDVTLVTLEGAEVEMPTPFDTFSRSAHHGYPGASARARRHRELLRDAMERAGFVKNRMEWWHYQLPRSGRFPVQERALDP